MLSFNLREGDDFWLGKEDLPLESWSQVVLNKASSTYMTVLTPDEAIDVPLGSDIGTDLGLYNASLVIRDDPVDSGLFSVGISAEPVVKIMRGRVYRRQLDG
jgi:hypothetical protein